MKWKDIKRILSTTPEQLSPQEIQTSTKIVFPFLSIFLLLPTIVYFYFSGPEFDTFNIIILSSVIFALFTILGIVFKKRLFGILRLLALLFFVLSLICLEFSNPTVAKIGWLAILGWTVYFIKEIIYLSQHFLKV